MEKKIIAVACVLLVLVAAFTACGKAIVTGDNGMEYEAVTDEEGNTVVNENGDIVVYVTDVDGNYVEDANGEPQTNSITFPSVIAHEDRIETANYILLIPEGWTAESDGTLAREADENAEQSIEITNFGELEDGETFAGKMQESQATLEGLAQAVIDNGGTAESAVESVQFFEQDATLLELTATAQQRTFRYQMLYFMQNGELYKVQYTATDMENEAFDLHAFVLQNLTMK